MSQGELSGFEPPVPLRYPRSPLTWLGNKRKQVPFLLSRIPRDCLVMSPFCGSCSVELALVARGQAVRMSDAYGPLVEFWSRLRWYQHELAAFVRSWLPMTMERAQEGKDRWLEIESRLSRGEDVPGEEQGNYLLLASKVSYRGLLRSRGVNNDAPDRFNEALARRIETWDWESLPEWCFGPCREDYTVGMVVVPCMIPGVFVYADPPYMLGKESRSMYGSGGELHRDFDYDELARRLRDHPGDWGLSFNDCEWARDTFGDCRIEEVRQGHVRMNTKGGKRGMKEGRELYITSMV